MLRRTMLAGLASFALAGGCSSSGGKAQSHPTRLDIADTLARLPEFSLFRQWVVAAGYTRVKNRGPFTLFAPDDGALGDVRPALRTRLMRPESRDLLRAVIDHHVVARRVAAGELRPRTTLRTIDGGEVRITRQGQSLRFGTGNLTRTNIEASNGLIHAIDQVQFPPDVTFLRG